MNERITKLARQAGFTDFPDDKNGVWITDGYWDEQLERFAELVRADEREQMGSLCRDVIAREREACAKLCDRAAKSIRGRKKNG